MKEQVQAIVALLSLENPGIQAAMFARAIAGRTLARSQDGPDFGHRHLSGRCTAIGANSIDHDARRRRYTV